MLRSQIPQLPGQHLQGTVRIPPPVHRASTPARCHSHRQRPRSWPPNLHQPARSIRTGFRPTPAGDLSTTPQGSVALVDRGLPETGQVAARGKNSVLAGFRFPPEVITIAVRWYLRYGLSYRDVKELLAERGVTVDHVTVYREVQRFTLEFIEGARLCRHAPGDRWFADETYVKVAGQWTYLYRTVDQHGQVIDVLLSERRDLAAARRLFTRALRAGTLPAEVTTDRAPAYPRVLTSLSLRRCTSPSSMRTTPSKPITVG
jgi:transposase, IS6 family